MSVPFTPAWLARSAAATAFLPRVFDDPVARSRAAHQAAARPANAAVLESLVVATDAQARARDRLARPGCTAMVTGQQAGLFGGPLYTMYKAASVIVNARRLAEETGVDCVPVFWLQNEDHDFDEIATAAVLGVEGRVARVSVAAQAGDAGRSIAARRFDDSLLSALDAISAHLGSSSSAPEVRDALASAYRPGLSPDAAFRALVQRWFGEQGLLIVDPSHPRAREAARDVHRRAVRDAGSIASALSARASALADAGFQVQVHVRPGAPLSFFHPRGFEGPRHRVDPEGGRFRLVGTDGLVDEVELLDGACSTSALLRPVLQDAWLPTVGYVGGPGEIAYFAQIGPVYEAFGLPLPLVVPRARFRVVDETTDRLVAQLGLDAALLEGPVERWATAGPASDEVARLEDAAAAIEATLSAARPRAAALDPALGKAAEKTAATVSDALSKLVDRYRRALAHRDQVRIDRVERLATRWCPDGAPQERVLSWPWAAARFGIDGLSAAVLAATVPFDGALRELRP